MLLLRAEEENGMQFVRVDVSEAIAIVELSRGKVNALNESVVEELANVFSSLKKDREVGGVVLSGYGEFFSFGFDVGEMLTFSKERFAFYLERFTCLYSEMFGFPKPLVIALNGHAIAGGCMLALAGDIRVMAEERAKMGMNEIAFGSALLAGSVEMLRFCVGEKKAQEVVYSGKLYGASEALKMGLVDQIVTKSNLVVNALDAARTLLKKCQPAFLEIKALLREPTLARMRESERESIAAFIDIWYSPDTLNRLKRIVIHS